MPSDSGSAWSPPASNSERRLSNSSDGSAGSGYSKAVSSFAKYTREVETRQVNMMCMLEYDKY